jgi:hypothetical protein
VIERKAGEELERMGLFGSERGLRRKLPKQVVQQEVRMGIARGPNGQLQKGHSLSLGTQWKPGQSGNSSGARHATHCQELIERHNCDEEMALMAAARGRYKNVSRQAQVAAYEAISTRAYGRAAVIQIANFNEVQFVKEIGGGVNQDDV